MPSLNSRLRKRRSGQESDSVSTTPIDRSPTALKLAGVMEVSYQMMRKGGNKKLAFFLEKLAPHIMREIQGVDEVTLQFGLQEVAKVMAACADPAVSDIREPGLALAWLGPDDDASALLVADDDDAEEDAPIGLTAGDAASA